MLALALAATCPAQAGAAPVKADLDRDKVSDELEARLAPAPDGRKVRVIVSLREAASSRRVATLEDHVGDFSLHDRFSIVDAFAATVTKRQVRRLAARSGVLRVEQDLPVRAFNDSAQAAFGVTEARIDAPSLEGDRDGAPFTYSKNDLVAAVIDSGIDPGHADLNGGKVIGFVDLVNARTGAYDDDGHGTHVAATIAGDGEGRADRRYRGVAPGAALVGVKVLDDQGVGFMSTVTAGIQWVVANKDEYGIEAINLSLGTEGCSDGLDATSLAVNHAHDQGLVVAVAAGNSGPGRCTIGSPGAAEDAVTVGAMADTGVGGFFQAYFSSRGRTADGRIKPDVSAPGWQITSAQRGTVDGYITMSGTSMATPFVAGLALLMRDVGPALTSSQVKQRLMDTAVDWGRGGDNAAPGSSGLDVDYGAGRVDAYAAIASAGASLDSPSRAPDHVLLEGSLSGSGDEVEFPIEVGHTCFPLAATLVHATGSGVNPDLDLVLERPDGTQADSSESIDRQEAVSHAPAAPGIYNLRVVSFAGAGEFFIDVSGALDTGPPCNTTLPPVSGTPQAGEVIHGGNGGWSGGGSIGYHHQWLRCDALGGGCSPIAGQVAPDHTATSADIGHTLRLRVTATNANGSGSAHSGAIGPVTASASQGTNPPPSTPQTPSTGPTPSTGTNTGSSPPSGGGQSQAPQPSAASVRAAMAIASLRAARALRRAGLRRVYRRRWFAFRVRALSAGTMSLKVHARVRGRRVLVARARREFSRAGSSRVRVRLTRRGRRLLGRARRMRLSVKVVFRERPGRRTAARRAVTVRP